MKRLRLFVCIICFVAAGVLVSGRPSVGQSDSDDRSSALATQVASVEARIAAFEESLESRPAARNGTHEMTVRLTITGKVDDLVTVHRDESEWIPTCSGRRLLSDIDRGTPVLIRDVQGTVVGRATLETGAWMPFSPDDQFGMCEFVISPLSIGESPYYSIAIGNHMEMSFSLEELDSTEWTVRIEAAEFTHR